VFVIIKFFHGSFSLALRVQFSHVEFCNNVECWHGVWFSAMWWRVLGGGAGKQTIEVEQEREGRGRGSWSLGCCWLNSADSIAVVMLLWFSGWPLPKRCSWRRCRRRRCCRWRCQFQGLFWWAF